MRTLGNIFGIVPEDESVLKSGKKVMKVSARMVNNAILTVVPLTAGRTGSSTFGLTATFAFCMFFFFDDIISNPARIYKYEADGVFYIWNI